ncbi:CocE/NonD family hydrolase [candidate division WOR-3 bacterium]|nr:CocE/NonD family hydrolase [candidate division WOR-3 bacterium]
MKRSGLLIVSLVFIQGADAQYSYVPVSIMMRDSKYLAADIYAIDTLTPKPTILIQTPYNKFWYRYFIGAPEWQVPFDSIAYNYLVVDWRGFYGSAAAESVGYDRGLDGYDLVEWIADQPWSTGRIGTWGASALGIIQFMTAKHRPPHLTCCVPIVADAKTAYRDYYYGGDYLEELTVMRDSLGFTPESLILAHYTYDWFWILAEMLTSYPESVNVPMLLVTGWYDHNDDAPLEMFYALRDSSEPSVRDKHKFMVGPWTHSGVGRLEQGELTYPDGVDSLRSVSFRIFDFYLRDLPNGYEGEPVVRYYVLGEETWQGADDWYAVSDRIDTLFCCQNGALLSEPPGSGSPADSFLYDPRDPCPSIGGNRFDPFDNTVIVGPRDQRDSVEIRGDVVLYTTPVLTAPITVAGNVRVKLSVASNCEDTDFSVRLTDVYPDGRSMLIAGGIRRMRFRNSYSIEELMVPDDTYDVFIELKNIAYSFLPGHRLRMIVSSSDRPIFDANLNNGDSLYVAGDTVIARNTIFHEPGALSMVIMKTCSNSRIDEEHGTVSAGKIVFYAAPGDRIKVRLYCPACAPGKMVVYDCLGREVEVMHEGMFNAGSREYHGGEDLPPGIYFIMMNIEDQVHTAKTVLVH